MLFAARLLMGLSEGGVMPISHAMVAAEVTRWRALAMGVAERRPACLGRPVALVLVPVALAFGWRNAFFIAAIPGLICALLIVLFVIERPSQGRAARQRGACRLISGGCNLVMAALAGLFARPGRSAADLVNIAEPDRCTSSSFVFVAGFLLSRTRRAGCVVRCRSSACCAAAARYPRSRAMGARSRRTDVQPLPVVRQAIGQSTVATAMNWAVFPLRSWLLSDLRPRRAAVVATVASDRRCSSEQRRRRQAIRRSPGVWLRLSSA